MPSSGLARAGSLLVALLPLTVSAVSYNYTLQDTYAGSNFYDGFNFFTDPDPTHGFVEYVDRSTAVNSGILGYGQGNTAKWGVDHSTVLYANSSTGRKSVRLEGNVNYNHGLFLADIKHMPGSICGVWPAFWTLGDSSRRTRHH
jgi:beta-glucanase (GH16 family)